MKDLSAVKLAAATEISAGLKPSQTTFTPSTLRYKSRAHSGGPYKGKKRIDAAETIDEDTVGDVVFFASATLQTLEHVSKQPSSDVDGTVWLF